MYNKIVSNYLNIKQQIYNFSLQSKFRQHVALLAVSKGHDLTAIEQLFHHGQIDFAENYVQELKHKQLLLNGLSINWHYIGQLQSNKIKYLAENVFWVHTKPVAAHIFSI